MALFVIGDPHLSLGADKAMDVFPGWENYVERIRLHWTERVADGDTVVLAGDISWGMSLAQALPDLCFLEKLPGKKLLLKGNHDYWWTTRAKMEAFFAENGLTSFGILHNCAAAAEGMALCGSRGWMFEKGEAHDRKIVLREAARLEHSLEDAEAYGGERVVFLHYPPLYEGCATPELIEVMARRGVRRCYYGHLHAAACESAFCGTFMGIDFQLVSADYLRFCPLRIEPAGG